MRRFAGEGRPDRKGRWQSPRTAKCGHCRITRDIEVRIGPHGASYGGLVRCSSVWACPVCAAAIKSERAEEVRRVVAWHGRERCALLTLTVRHGLGDDFHAMVRGVSNAWRRFVRGASWRRFSEQWGIEGSIRALETTHGEHGWHPHLHVVLLLGERGPAVDWRVAHERAWTWVAKRWRECVVAELGADACPDLLRSGRTLDYDAAADRVRAHGVDLRQLADSGAYLVKLGLEVSDPWRKKSRSPLGRTPLQIATDLARSVRRGEDGELGWSHTDAALWGAYVDGTRGRKMLTWSRGLKKRAGILEKEDEELLDDQERTGEQIAIVAGEDWRELRELHGAKVALLECVERAAAPGECRVLAGEIVGAWVAQTLGAAQFSSRAVRDGSPMRHRGATGPPG